MWQLLAFSLQEVKIYRNDKHTGTGQHTAKIRHKEALERHNSSRLQPLESTFSSFE